MRLRKIGELKPCSFQGCDRFAMTRGLCTGHYQQRCAGMVMKPLMKKTRRLWCTFPGCEKPHRAKGYCISHLTQMNRGVPLRPLGLLEPSPIVLFPDHAEVILLNRDGDETGRAIIDLDDVSSISDRRWFQMTNCNDRARPGYAACKERSDGREVAIYMHRFLLGNAAPHEGDHKDGNRLNNRRYNLRAATDGQNCQNTVRRGRETMRNVYFDKRVVSRPWVVSAQLNGRRHYGGSYSTKEEAVVAARVLRSRLFTHHNEERHAVELAT